ncbi:MAG: OmpA family protein [Brevinematales bacterium]|jgi:chemotaxis protein MotB
MKQISVFLSIAFLLIITAGCSTVKPEELTKLQADNANLTAENQSLMNDLKTSKSDVSALQDQRDNLQKQLIQISNDNIGLKNQVDSTKAGLGKQVDNLNASIKANNLKMTDLQNEIKDRDKQITDLQSQVKSLSSEQAKFLQEKNQELSNLTMTHEKLEAAMQLEIANGDLKIQQLGDMLSVNFQDKIFFDSGSADIRNSGKKTLDKVAAVLKSITNKEVRVEGYTDNVPIAPGYRWKFPSNWELSVARATTIVRYLQSQGIDPSLLKATGYGEYNPASSNDTPEGKAQNRKIAIELVPLDQRARFK